ncbi:MAG: DJ-1/PfpI family protein [Pseudomonadota bacterium]
MKTIGALLFPDFELLDLFGPLEMFGLLPDHFDLTLIAETTGPVPSNQKVAAHAEVTLADAPSFDILLIPGGSGTRAEKDNPPLLDWLRGASERADLTLSVCTGSILLALAGLLDGRRATTNKLAFARLTPAYPKVHWQAQARWVEDGPIWTSSGVSAGMDMSLAVIAHLHGAQTAERVASWAEYTWHRDAAHDPFAATHGLD